MNLADSEASKGSAATDNKSSPSDKGPSTESAASAPAVATNADMTKAGYMHLQRIYSTCTEHERTVFRGRVQISIGNAFIKLFVCNACALRALCGRRRGAFGRDPIALGSYPPLFSFHRRARGC